MLGIGKKIHYNPETHELIHEYSADELAAAVQATVSTLENRNEFLTEQLNNFKEQAYKDGEIERYKAQAERAMGDLNRGFGITKQQKIAIQEWKIKHAKEKHDGNHYGGAIGGGYTYCFTPTSIGTIGVIKCTCGAEYTFAELD